MPLKNNPGCIPIHYNCVSNPPTFSCMLLYRFFAVIMNPAVLVKLYVHYFVFESHKKHSLQTVYQFSKFENKILENSGLATKGPPGKRVDPLTNPLKLEVTL